MGLNEENLSYLDQFRQLVTQVGNALGYVRMIRAGGLQCCAQGCQFVPDLADIPKFATLSTELEGLNKETLRAAEILDDVVDNLVQNFAEGTEYFKVKKKIVSQSQAAVVSNYYFSCSSMCSPGNLEV